MIDGQLVANFRGASNPNSRTGLAKIRLRGRQFREATGKGASKARGLIKPAASGTVAAHKNKKSGG
jgi:hypothetical protein